jgi:hypothetical protein
MPVSSGPRFSDPFVLPSSQEFPTNITETFKLSKFLWYLVPEFRAATIRLVSHFITDISFEGDVGSIDERDELESILYNKVNIKGVLRAVGISWGCFARGTRTVTRDGVFEIQDLVGKRVDVLSKGGVYRPADFKSFGVQELLEVEFSDGRKVLATPGHQWEVKNGGSRTVRIPTTALVAGHHIERTVAPRPAKNEEYFEGIRHGFIYGDGSLSSKNSPKSVALFMGEKVNDMLPYFEGHGNAPRVRPDHKETMRQSGFPGAYKALPAPDRSASYWFGFVSGFLAADGNADGRDGCVMLGQKSREVLEAVVAQLPRIGMCAGKITRVETESCFLKGTAKERRNKGVQHRVILLRRFMQADDFLRPAHRKNFEKGFKHTKYGQYIGVRSVTRTGRFEEVFCCVEMETHSFVIENGILTGNCYGNGFARLHLPFDRYLIDTRNGRYHFWPVSMFRNLPGVQYNWRNLTYTVPDPLALKTSGRDAAPVEFEFFDRRVPDVSRIKMILLNPEFLILDEAQQSGRIQVIDRFDPEYLADIKNNRMHQINDTPSAILGAIKDDNWFRYEEDEVFHLREPALPGMTRSGWGCPPAIENYRSIHQLMVYRKIDEMIGRDFMVPFRVVTPNIGNNVGESSLKVLLGPWRGEMQKMFAARRKDEFAFHTLPFDVNYHEFNNSGKTLSTKDHIEWQVDSMLNAMGYPAEIFKGTMAIQQLPTAVRMLENQFHFLHWGMEQLLKWTTKKVQDFLQRPYIDPVLPLPRMADDLEQRGVYMQLAAGGEVPRRIAYGPFNIKDPVEAAKERMREDIEIQEAQQELQTEMQRKQQLGSMGNIVMQGMQQGQPGAPQGGPGGAPGGQGVPVPGNVTPLDIMNTAQGEAQRMLSMPEGPRFSELRKMEASQPALHAATKQMMEKIRSQGGSVGRQNAMQILGGQ